MGKEPEAPEMRVVPPPTGEPSEEQLAAAATLLLGGGAPPGDPGALPGGRARGRATPAYGVQITAVSGGLSAYASHACLAYWSARPEAAAKVNEYFPATLNGAQVAIWVDWMARATLEGDVALPEGERNYDLQAALVEALRYQIDAEIEAGLAGRREEQRRADYQTFKAWVKDRLGAEDVARLDQLYAESARDV